MNKQLLITLISTLVIVSGCTGNKSDGAVTSNKKGTIVEAEEAEQTRRGSNCFGMFTTTGMRFMLTSSTKMAFGGIVRRAPTTAHAFR